MRITNRHLDDVNVTNIVTILEYGRFIENAPHIPSAKIRTTYIIKHAETRRAVARTVYGNAALADLRLNRR